VYFLYVPTIPVRMNFLLYAERGITLHNMGIHKIVGSDHGAKLLNQSDPNGSFFFYSALYVAPTVPGKTVRIRFVLKK
jgi:hypothetical protein